MNSDKKIVTSSDCGCNSSKPIKHEKNLPIMPLELQYMKDIDGNNVLSGRTYKMCIASTDSYNYDGVITEVKYRSWGGYDYLAAADEPLDINLALQVEIQHSLGGYGYPVSNDPDSYFYMRVPGYNSPSKRNYIAADLVLNSIWIGATGLESGETCPDCKWNFQRLLYNDFPSLGRRGVGNRILSRYQHNMGYASLIQADKPGDWLKFYTSNHPPTKMDLIVFIP
ncbi:hypothetical protein [Bacillus toyonensis]|uniref:hypothetical protein n=1 Tax=Bacillus toyonensis TaxID=155322 RepID=UPI002E1F10AC|nr:hypothetical protein [Bacillus toyonensis]